MAGNKVTDPAAQPVVLKGHTGWVSSVAFSPDNRWVLTGSWDNTARLWMLQIEDLLTLARHTAGRNLSEDEWKTFLPGQPYFGLPRPADSQEINVWWRLRGNDIASVALLFNGAQFTLAPTQ